MNLNIKGLQEEWFNHEVDKLYDSDPNKRKRKYIHFDYRLPEINKKAVQFVWRPDQVIGHSFYPFVKNTIKIRKYDKSKEQKINEKPRDIYYASHKDALIFSWYNHLLNNYYEIVINAKDINKSVIAYRALSKSNADFALRAFEFIKEIGECVVLCFDIEKFFDRLNHLRIKQQWKKILGLNIKSGLPRDHYAIYKAITKFTFVDLKILSKNLKTAKAVYVLLLNYAIS
jgi:hypothetical protein